MRNVPAIDSTGIHVLEDTLKEAKELTPDWCCPEFTLNLLWRW